MALDRKALAVGKAVLQGFIATSAVVPMYGKAVLSEDDVRRVFESIRAGHAPMTPNHDERQVVNSRYLNLELKRTPTGDLGVWAEVEFDDEEQAARYGGWSIGWFDDTYIPDEHSPLPPVRFGADAYHFTDDERDAAAAELRRAFDVLGGRYFQLGIEPPASVVLIFVAETLRAIPANLLANVLYDALKRLLPQGTRRRSSLFKFSVRKGRDGEVDVRGVLETSDPEVLKAAVGLVGRLAAQQEGVYEFDPERGEWRLIPRSERK